LSAQAVLTNLLLPPLGLMLAILVAGFLAWRGRRWAGAAAVAGALGVLLLSTPFAAGWLTASLEDRLRDAALSGQEEPRAIVILGGEMAHGDAGPEVGPLTLERLRAGAALHRRTGLPVLVTGGPLSGSAPPIAALMAASLETDFGIRPRWVEARARDTRDNAAFSAAMLRAEGVGSALVVSHAWHLPRALAAFGRQGFPVRAAPVRLDPWPSGGRSDWVPRPDHLAQSWFALREWVGLLVYRLRDGE
jgi:uncharacterized SAM-binding protein YcdF (DUF218 family)